MKKFLIFSLTFLLICSFFIILPNVYAVSGEITLDQSEFTLYRGNMITFPVIIEMNDYTFNPILEITHNDNVTQKIFPLSIGDTFQSTIGLNENWDSGEYIINLKYQNQILDSKSFIILRDNKIKSEIIIYDSMTQKIEPFISLSTDKLILENSSHETIYITGNIYSSQTGHPVIINITKPDGMVDTINVKKSTDGGFTGQIQIDKHWSTGEYFVSASSLNKSINPKLFYIQNNSETPIFTLSQLTGSFDISSETSHEFTILGISGDVETNESQVMLSILKDDIILYEDILTLVGGSFETSMVLYDYVTNTPWEYGKYQINGLIDEQIFHSKSFTLNNQSFSVPQIHNMNLFLDMQGELQKIVDSFEIEIKYRESKQVILSGTLNGYGSGTPITVHLINPNGVDSKSYIIASKNGAYYTPIIITDTWISGKYTAYVTYGDIVEDPLYFSVINNESDISNAALDEISSENTSDNSIIVELQNYDIIIEDTKTRQDILFTQQFQSNLQKVPIMIVTPDNSVIHNYTLHKKMNNLEYITNIDHTWISGNYYVYYVENNIPNALGTFHITNNVIETREIISPEPIVEMKYVDSFEINKTIFHIRTHSVDELFFSGVINDYSDDKILIILDDKIIASLIPNDDRFYSGFILLDDKYSKGYHNISVKYDDVILENIEFLIATNNYLSLKSDIIISKNEIIESGGLMMVSLSGSVPNFNPSEMSSVIIEITGIDSQQFLISPKGYGFYLQNFEISDKIGIYNISANYDGQIIDSFEISVIPADISYVKTHTKSWIDGSMSDYSYLQKASLVLNDNYDIPLDVQSPEWFVESAQRWLNDSVNDDSFYDMILFLAKNDFK